MLQYWTQLCCHRRGGSVQKKCKGKGGSHVSTRGTLLKNICCKGCCENTVVAQHCRLLLAAWPSSVLTCTMLRQRHSCGRRAQSRTVLCIRNKLSTSMATFLPGKGEKSRPMMMSTPRTLEEFVTELNGQLKGKISSYWLNTLCAATVCYSSGQSRSAWRLASFIEVLIFLFRTEKFLPLFSVVFSSIPRDNSWIKP